MQMVMIIVLCISSIIQLHFWLIRLDKLNRHTPTKNLESTQPKPSVTVIIACKNESKNLEKNLVAFLEQDYPFYEIIVVDDHSTDDTSDLIMSYERNGLKYLKLLPENYGKKAALTYGIEESTSDWILVTDADCNPNSKSWISSMMSSSEKNDVVLGFSPYIKSSGWLNTWIRYETHFVAMQYLSAAIINLAYMGVGRNMAFRRTVFEEVGGYESHKNVKSGDDDLLIASLGNDYNYNINTKEDAWIWTYAEDTFRGYIDQKRRHLTTAPKYRLITRLRLMLLFASQFFWYTSVIWLSFIHPMWIILLLVRGTIILFVNLRSQNKLGGGLYLFMSPILDFGLCFFYFMMSFTYFKPKEDW